jgi:vacuolar protein sorting-associated protein 18
LLSSPADLDLGAGRSGDHAVHRVSLDPGGKHCITTVVHPGGAETYYHHARWPRPKLLPRLRGLLVNAVAWNRQSITEGDPSWPFDRIDVNVRAVIVLHGDC